MNTRRDRRTTRAVAVLAVLAARLAFGEGELDYTFHAGGTTFAPLPYVLDATYASCAGGDVVVQPDGKMLIGGACDLADLTAQSPYQYTAVATVLRLNADGTLDTSFGNAAWPSSMTYPAVPGYQFIATGTVVVSGSVSVALRPDGRIVVGGSFADVTRFNAQSIAIAQLTADGAFDATFGSGGVTTRALAANTGGDNLLSRIAIDGAGRIVIAGSYFAAGSSSSANSDFLFGVIAGDGASATLSSYAFDLGGTLADRALDVAIDSQGRYVFAGSVTPVAAALECGILRVDPATLQPDPTFGGAGAQTFSFDTGGFNDECVALALRGDDSIVLAANVSGTGVGVAHLDASGQYDATFGRRLVPALASVGRVAIQSWDGKILLAGDELGSGACGSCAYDFGVVRLTPAGAVDTAFTATTPGSGPGLVVVDFAFEQPYPAYFQAFDHAHAIAFDGHDAVVAGTSSADSANQSYVPEVRFAVTRLGVDDIFRADFEAPGGIACRSGSLSPSGFASHVATTFEGANVCIPPATFSVDGYGSVSVCATSTCGGGVPGCPAVLHTQPGTAAFTDHSGLPAPSFTLDLSGVPAQLDPFDAPIQYSLFGLGQSCTATFSNSAFAISGTLDIDSDHQWGGFPYAIESVSVDGFTTSATGCLAPLIDAAVADYAPLVTQYLEASVAAMLPATYQGVDVCQKQ